ncbi:MAG TPA: ABC transporter ATP-binding protein [Egibacteraceae bacterium]|nr:ABC transporter ATP-binding protein [Egibacteraceae bacterium]
MLEVDDIHVFYGNIEAVKGVSFDVEEGEIVTLIGGNGAGKTTTLRTISGVKNPRTGSISWRGNPIHNLPSHEIVALGISQSPEGRRIFPRMTVTENLDMGTYGRRDKSNLKGDLDRVFELFPRLQERRKQLGGTLSGGEQQMLAMGRALMARPRMLMLDEPSLGLAPKLIDTIFSVIREINGQGTTVLMVEQNAFGALKLAHRGYVLESGEIVLSDDADKLLTNPEVRKAYLGE